MSILDRPSDPSGRRRVPDWIGVWLVGRVAPSATLLLAFLLTAPAIAATQVFHSPADDGQPAAGAPEISEGGVQSVFIYIDGGAVASLPAAPCNDGQGDEICGYELTLTGLGGLTLAGFTPDPGADVLANLSAGSVLLGGLDTQSPTPGPQRIGELLVNANTGGSVEISAGEAIRADLSSETIGTGTLVSVPEPGALLGLGAGLGLLIGLARRRAGRC